MPISRGMDCTPVAKVGMTSDRGIFRAAQESGRELAERRACPVCLVPAAYGSGRPWPGGSDGALADVDFVEARSS